MQRLAEGYDDEVTEEEPNLDEEPEKKCATKAGCFDCNICLDYAVDPVVTLCGHLYCWPCMYKWFQQRSRTSSLQCPVCKAVVSQETLVPLYGRGDNSKKPYEDMDIPHRPSGCRGSNTNQHTNEIQENYRTVQASSPQLQYNHRQGSPYVNATNGYMSPYSQLGTIGVFNSTVSALLAGMAVDFLPSVFRNQRFPGMHYSSPYYAAGNNESPRLRRQELEVQRSLNRIWLFLFCCAILCLLLF